MSSWRAKSAPTNERMAASNWMWPTCTFSSVFLKSDPYPITPKEHGTDFLMEHRHLWLR